MLRPLPLIGHCLQVPTIPHILAPFKVGLDHKDIQEQNCGSFWGSGPLGGQWVLLGS